MHLGVGESGWLRLRVGGCPRCALAHAGAPLALLFELRALPGHTSGALASSRGLRQRGLIGWCGSESLGRYAPSHGGMENQRRRLRGGGGSSASPGALGGGGAICAGAAGPAPRAPHASSAHVAIALGQANVGWHVSLAAHAVEFLVALGAANVVFVSAWQAAGVGRVPSAANHAMRAFGTQAHMMRPPPPTRAHTPSTPPPDSRHTNGEGVCPDANADLERTLGARGAALAGALGARAAHRLQQAGAQRR